MKTTKRDLQELITEQRKILEFAEKQGRELTEAEEARFNELDDEYSRLSGEVRDIKDDDGWLESAPSVLEAMSKNVTPDRATKSFRFWANPHETSRRAAFCRALVYGTQSLNAEEFRALQADVDTAGGFLVLPVALRNQIIMSLEDRVWMRQMATVIPVPNADSLGCPILDNDPADPTWTAEIKTGTEDSTMDFERRDLHPHPLAKRIKVSNKLLRVSTLNPDQIVINRLTYRFAVTEENAFLNGDGSNEPLGVFTASAQGIDTDRDVTASTATTIKADDLIDALYNLKGQYQERATWIFHRDAVKKIRKLKDGEGQYLWQSGIAEGRPANILGRPYRLSEHAPNTFSSGQYVGIIGDFSFYLIADSLEMQVQRLVELYAETNQTGFIGRKETDGMPGLSEAFTRIKLA